MSFVALEKLFLTNYVCAIFLLFLANSSSAQSFRDPTTPINYTRAKPYQKKNKILLNAIYVRSNHLVAVINGKSVKVNQIVDGVNVVDITSHSITYSHEGKRTTVSLRPRLINSVKRMK